MIKAFFNEILLVKGKREILNNFRRIHLKLHFLHVSGARNARVTFIEKLRIKIFSFQNEKQGSWMFNAILDRQSFKGYCCESEYILILFVNF